MICRAARDTFIPFGFIQKNSSGTALTSLINGLTGFALTCPYQAFPTLPKLSQVYVDTVFELRSPAINKTDELCGVHRAHQYWLLYFLVKIWFRNYLDKVEFSQNPAFLECHRYDKLLYWSIFGHCKREPTHTSWL